MQRSECKLSLGEYLRARRESVLVEGVQLSKIGCSEAQLTRALGKYRPKHNL